MKTIQKLVIFSGIPSYSCYAQQDTLYGHLVDGETGEALIGGFACTPSCETGTVSDIFGGFALPQPSPSQELEFTYDAMIPLHTNPKDAYKIDAVMRPYHLYDFADKWFQWRKRRAMKREEQSNSFVFKGVLWDRNNQALAGVPIRINGTDEVTTDANGNYEIETTNDVDGILIFYPKEYGDASMPYKEKYPVEAVLVRE